MNSSKRRNQAIVDSGNVGFVKYEISMANTALRMYRQRDRNYALAAAMQIGCDYWIREFLPTRFTHYVERPPFGYPTHLSDKFILQKARAMGLLKMICDKYYGGWDPWQSAFAPPQVFEKWLHDQQAKGRYGYSFSGVFKRAHAEFRAIAKRNLLGELRGMADDGRFIPLVMTGNLRSVATHTARCIARSTKDRPRGVIRIPTDGPKAEIVNRIMRTLPFWEMKAIARVFGLALRDLLARGVASNSSAYPKTMTGASSQLSERPGAGSVPRAADIAAPRSSGAAVPRSH